MTKGPASFPWKTSFLTVPVILGIGFLMGRISNSGYGNQWFDGLRKPAVMPPGWLFGAAWSVLYVLIGTAIALILTSPRSKERTIGIATFAAQLVLNFSWSPMFFAWHETRLALATLLAMLGLSIAAAIVVGRVWSLAGWLMVPYLAWLSFASYLNFEIIRLNPAA